MELSGDFYNEQIDLHGDMDTNHQSVYPFSDIWDSLVVARGVCLRKQAGLYFARLSTTIGFLIVLLSTMV